MSLLFIQHNLIDIEKNLLTIEDDAYKYIANKTSSYIIMKNVSSQFDDIKSSLSTIKTILNQLKNVK